MRRKSSRPGLKAGEWEQFRSPSHHLHYTLLPDGPRWTRVVRLADLHRLVLCLLGPIYEDCYLVIQQTAE